MQIIIYEILVFLCILLFAIYDIRWRRVSNKALVFFCPIAVMAPFIQVWGREPLLLGKTVTASALGAAAAFCILLAAAMFSKGGTGIGGGDIKLGAVMGFIYGASRISLILLIASFLASVAAAVVKTDGRKEQLSLPFVPFLAYGSAVATVIQILS